MSILPFQASNENVPLNLREKILQAIQAQSVDSKQSALMTVYCPSPESQNLAKVKFALVFPNQTAVAQFIEEVKNSEDKQTRLSIEDYSVFGNVMFAFLRRPYKLHTWVQQVRDVILNQPYAVLLFNQRFKYLVDLVGKGIHLSYHIEWDYIMQTRRYNKKNQASDDEPGVSSNYNAGYTRKVRAPKTAVMSASNRRMESESLSQSESYHQKKVKINEKIEEPTISSDRKSSKPKPRGLFDMDIKSNYNSKELTQLMLFLTQQLKDKVNEMNEFFVNFQQVMKKLERAQENGHYKQK